MKLTTTQRVNKVATRLCTGGPYAGERLTLTQHGDRKTAYFRVGEWRGRYVNAIWEDKRTES